MCLWKNFGGTNIRRVKSHMNLEIRQKPDHIPLHVGKNDLNSDREQKITSN